MENTNNTRLFMPTIWLACYDAGRRAISRPAFTRSLLIFSIAASERDRQPVALPPLIPVVAQEVFWLNFGPEGFLSGNLEARP